MLSRLIRDKRGASAVTYVFILPLFVLLAFGTFEIFKVISVRQSLSLGAYKAARHLSAYGRTWLAPTSPANAWENAARQSATEIIDQELEDNDFLPQGYSLRVQVVIDSHGRDNPSRLGWLFTIRAELAVPNLIRLPPLKFGTITLVERQVSYIEGLSGDWIPPEDSGPY
jgi:hypothetical protein